MNSVAPPFGFIPIPESFQILTDNLESRLHRSAEIMGKPSRHNGVKIVPVRGKRLFEQQVAEELPRSGPVPHDDAAPDAVTVEEEVYLRVVSHMEKSGIPFSSWYVGVASKPKDRLFPEHLVSETEGLGIIKDAVSDEAAREIE